MATTSKSPKGSNAVRDKAAEHRASLVSREVMQRLGRDQCLVDRLVEEMEASMASTSDTGDGYTRYNGVTRATTANEAGVAATHEIHGSSDANGNGVSNKPDAIQQGEHGCIDKKRGTAAEREKTAVECDRATMKALLEQLLQQRERTGTTSGSNLLGELKQCIDLESLVVRRCWEIMEEEWFDDMLRNTAPS